MKELKDTRAEVLNELETATHLFKTTCLNKNGQTKTIYTFVDFELDWFGVDEFESKHVLPVANGGTAGKVETFNAGLNQILLTDDSVKEYQTTIYRTNPFKTYLKFNKVIKEQEYRSKLIPKSEY